MHYTQFNISTAAQSYAEIAGVVAGIAFAALAILVQGYMFDSGTKKGKKEKKKEQNLIEQAFVFLGITFFGNLATAILWGLVAGEPMNLEDEKVISTLRSELVTVFSTFNWALATPLILLTFVFLVNLSNRLKMVRKFFIALFYVAICLALVFLNLTVLDALIGSDALSELGFLPHAIGLGVLILGAIFGVNCWKLKITDGRIRKNRVYIFAYSWLVLIFLSMSLFAVISGSHENVYWWPSNFWPMWLFYWLWGGLMIFAIVFLLPPLLPDPKSPK